MKTLLFAVAYGAGVFLVAGAAAAPIGPAPAMRVVELRCEHRTDPSGIGEANPRLSWELVATDPGARNLKQSACQILVADSPEALARDQGDLWDSGRIASDAAAEIAYAGRTLASREGCWWKVRIWDASGQTSGWSEPARWTMALLEPSAWRAEWIGLDAAPPAGALTDVQRARVGALAWMQADAPPSGTSPASVVIRRGFTIPADRTLTRATFIVMPDQWCTITLNGRGIGEAARWEPPVPFDLTASVARGDNVLGLRVTQADGYAPAVAGELELTFADGGYVRLEIDPTWRFSTVAADGWDIPGFSGPPWAPLKDLSGRATPWGSPNNSFKFFPPPPLLRKTFQVAQPVRRATLYATALGLYEAQVNGARVGRDYFTPGWTDYAHRVQYQTYDVTDLVKPGANTLQALLATGGMPGSRPIQAGARSTAAIRVSPANWSWRTGACRQSLRTHPGRARSGRCARPISSWVAPPIFGADRRTGSPWSPDSGPCRERPPQRSPGLSSSPRRSIRCGSARSARRRA
jgi:alpha-L-rhamnosidase